ncbi:hypothetical protein L1987_59054 [Smallanthus sonchifolius]|uniref:Uncharacterized protein n=1 Tax=Smallanthus sonchifolius TaxID=185202 RepID=A0ACB9D461_9ASTR|nr:hypothetical protein L1987_59054 [Smallanthus sonchifolius]
MDTVRTVYSVSRSKPGSDVAAETTALAAASLVFEKYMLNTPNYFDYSKTFGHRGASSNQFLKLSIQTNKLLCRDIISRLVVYNIKSYCHFGGLFEHMQLFFWKSY